MTIPPDVREQALHPFRELLLPAGWKRVEGKKNVLVCCHTYPIAQVVEPTSLGPADVDEAVEEARELVRAESKDRLVLWLEPAFE